MKVIEACDPCTLCPTGDHAVEDHEPCEECGGTWEPLNEDGVCGTCLYEDSLIAEEDR